MGKKRKVLSLNLLPKKEESFGDKFLRWSFTFGRYIIIGTEIVVLLAFFSRFKLDRDFIDLKDQIKQKEVILVSFKPIEDDVNKLQNRLMEIKKVDQGQGRGIVALPLLAPLTPEGITYKTIKISGDKISLIGFSQDSARLAAFLTNLKDVSLFKKDSVLLESVERSRDDARILFTIQAISTKGEQ